MRTNFEKTLNINELIEAHIVSSKAWKASIDALLDNTNETKRAIRLIINMKSRQTYGLIFALEKFLKQNQDTQKELMTDIENLLSEERYSKFFPITKKGIFSIFAKINPQDKMFLMRLHEALLNPLDINMQRIALDTVEKIVENNQTANLPREILSKVQFSRTIILNLGENNPPLNNFIEAYNFINKKCTKDKKASRATVEDLILIHKLVTKDLKHPQYEEWSGVLRGKYWEDRTKFKDSPYADFTKVQKEIKDFSKWLKINYDKLSAFKLAACVYKKLITIHPFYDANGRTIRLFADYILLTKGYKMEEYPPDWDLAVDCSYEELACLIEENSKPANSLKISVKVCHTEDEPSILATLGALKHSEYKSLIMGLGLFEGEDFNPKIQSTRNHTAINQIRSYSCNLNLSVQIALVTNIKNANKLIKYISAADNTFNKNSYDILQIDCKMSLNAIKFVKETFPNKKIIAKFGIPSFKSEEEFIKFKNKILRYAKDKNIDAILLDSSIPSSGTKFDWQIGKTLIELIRLKTIKPIGIAGGLSPKNVEEAIKFLHPDFIDGNTGFRFDECSKTGSKTQINMSKDPFKVSKVLEIAYKYSALNSL